MLALYLYLLCFWPCGVCSVAAHFEVWPVAEPACIVFPAWRTGTGGSTGDRHTNAPYLSWNHTPGFFLLSFFLSDSSAHRNFTASYSNETTLCLNSGGQRLWRTNRNQVCVWYSIVDEWNLRSAFAFLRRGSVERESDFETAPGVTSALSRWIMLHMSEAFCTAVTAISSRCTAHTGWCQMLSGSPVALS